MNKKVVFLHKIASIDELLHINRKKLDNHIISYAQRLSFYKFIKIVNNIKVRIPLLVIYTLIIYFLVHKFVLTIVITLLGCLIFNYVLIYLRRKLKPTEEYYEKIKYYNEEYIDLMNSRNTYVNLYDYLLYGDQAILQNIKRRMNNKEYYDYNICSNKIWLHQDIEALSLFKEMQNKEKLMLNDITNEIKSYLMYNNLEERDFLNNILFNLTTLN